MNTPGKVSVVAFSAGFLLLATAGILVLTSPSQDVKQLRGRFLQATGQYNGGQVGLSGTPSSDLASGSGSFDNSLFGGNHYYTAAPAGVVGGEWIVYIVMGLLCGGYAWFYKLSVVDQIAPLPPQNGSGKDDFDVGICDCLWDAFLCFPLAIPCCVYVRQAHTNQVTGICGFWTTFWAYFLGGLCCGIGPCCLTVFFRMKLKEHMGIEDHIMNDLCCAWACAPCAVGQVAMAVDQKLGYEVDACCCKLNWDRETEQVFQDGDYQ